MVLDGEEQWRGVDDADRMSKVFRIGADGTGEWVDKGKAKKPPRANEPDIVSDSLGVTKWQVDEFREDARKNGFRVDFVTDRGPSAVEGFFPAKGSPSEIARYEKYRQGCVAETGRAGGSVVSAEDLEAAQRVMRQRYPIKEGA